MRICLVTKQLQDAAEPNALGQGIHYLKIKERMSGIASPLGLFAVVIMQVIII